MYTCSSISNEYGGNSSILSQSSWIKMFISCCCCIMQVSSQLTYLQGLDLVMCHGLCFWCKWEHWGLNLGSLQKLHPAPPLAIELSWSGNVTLITLILDLQLSPAVSLNNCLAILIIWFGAVVGQTTYYEQVSEYLSHISKCRVVNMPIIAGNWNWSAVPVPIASNSGACRG